MVRTRASGRQLAQNTGRFILSITLPNRQVLRYALTVLLAVAASRRGSNSPSTNALGAQLTHRHNRWLWQLVLAAMLVLLAVVAFWPSPVDQPVQGQLADILNFLHRHGTPAWFNYKFVEASANVALFVPLGFVSALAFPNRRWWQMGAFGLLVSSCMELGQHLFLHSRFASPLDLVTNALGAVIGGLLGSLLVRKKGAAAFRQRTPERLYGAR